ncbi:hypothetical protein GIB67_027008 [Kingdonia uniflora]|uniref:Pentatricopeptide repeat-containing protein n=1 Tax=Kingdonia uniflora TaxID=39325 RepID=A0A7J7P1W9_9MAGN|nr:hypothetical protein GIB67_027008 [Kingdonia uniflora]
MFPEMEQILDQMKHEHRFAPKEIVLCNVIAYYGRARLPESALRMFDEIPSFRCERTVRSLNCLLNALLNCKQFEKIREIYANVDRYGVLDVCSYNMMINACCLSGCVSDGWSLFEKMLRKGIQPNAVTFGTLVSGFCANSMLDEALMLKKEMVKWFNVKPDVCVYNSLIKGFGKGNNLGMVYKLRDEMLKTGVRLNSNVYSTLISVFFRVGRKEKVSRVLEKMRENGCKPDVVTYNAIITGFCNGKDFESAFGVLNEMKEKGCKADVLSYNIIVSGLCKEGKLNEALDLFEDMPKRECASDVVTYRTLFDGLCDAVKLKEALLILNEMLFKGFAPRIASVNKLVDGLCLEGNMKLLELVLRSIAKENVSDINTWRIVITTLCKDRVLNSLQLVDALIML